MKIARTKAAWSKRLSAVVLSAAMALSLIPANALPVTAAENTKELAGPVIDTELEDTSLVPVSKQLVTWDCIWFGSYPQTEVIKESMKESYDADEGFRIYSEIAKIETPYLVSDSVYDYLADPDNEDQWENNDIIYEGVKYRRMTKLNATLIGAEGASILKGRYHWRDDTNETYHYFKWEPIKWRVLSVADDGKLLLLADKALDDQLYNKTLEGVTWETCSLRTWLNDDFLNAAFTTAEQSSIKTTTVTGTIDGDSVIADTQDKVFILSKNNEMNNTAYGFMEDVSQSMDEARYCRTSTYAKAMGASSSTTAGYYGNGYCWMRDTASTTKKAYVADVKGFVLSTVYVNVTNVGYCARPAITLDASAPYYYAGTVSSDRTMNEVSYESSKAEALINALPDAEDITLKDEDAVIAAREAYDALSDAEKEGFDLTKLNAAEKKITELLQPIADTQDKIDKLPDAEDITLEDEAAVIAAREAYEALTDDQKERIDSEKLTAAEEKITGLLKPVTDAQALIDELPTTITLASESKITEVRDVYDALTDAQKSRVDSTKLTDAEIKLATLKQEITDVQELIDELPTTITLESESAITEARAAYNALTTEQQGRINVAALTTAETKLAALKQPSSSQSGSGSQTGTSGSQTSTSGSQTSTGGSQTSTGGSQTSTSGSQTSTSGSQTSTSQSSATQTKPVVKLNASKIPLQVKKTTTALKVTTIGKGDKVASWKSSNKKVATVTSKGKIKALKVGKATITVTTKKGAKATCTVTVQKAKVTTKSLKVSTGAKLKLKKGKKATITVTRNPITATEKITYQSSNTKIATVTKKGVVKAKKKGSCKITVKSSNGKKKVVKVTVTN